MTVADIYKYFREHNIKSVDIDYSGSGDDGGIDHVRIDYIDNTYTEDASIHQGLMTTLEEIIWDHTGADFNNEGSQGKMSFVFDEEEHKIKMNGQHENNIMTIETTEYDEELVDPDEYI